MGVKNGMGGGGGYGHSTGGLNLGAQHFNNRCTTDISEATKSRTGTRRIIAHSDHQQMITSNSASPFFTIPFRPLGIQLTADENVRSEELVWSLVARALGTLNGGLFQIITSAPSILKVHT